MERRHRVEVLFHEALALEPSARTSFLQEACSGEPELLEELVSLISAHEHPWSFIDSPVNYAKNQADDELSPSLIGTSIGRYQVVRLIKRSGMGEVYLARDTHLPREVALKLLPLMFTGDERRLRRFILEAEAASSLNHPNILTIHEIGHIRDVHYIATEFVDGQTLRERLADGRLELKEALEIAVGVANALVASHAAGIVHRDIKPENIMIRRDGYVKVLDFGLAKLTERPDVRVEGNGPNISSMDTDPGTFMGTVGYLSPEQAKSLEVDTRTDVFSLGIVLYEMITGQNPFNREAFSEVINAILTTEPPPLGSFVPNTPASLQKVVTKALAKDKQNRYQRTEDLLADLKAVQAQVQQQAMPRKLTPRERWWRIGIGAMAVILIALAGVAILQTMKSRNAIRVSDLSSRLRFNEIHSWKNDRGESAIDGRFSHDGKMIAFPMLKNEREGIWVKEAVSGAEPRLITTDQSSNNWPIWSPDDQRIAFVSTRDNKTGIWTSPVSGGRAELIALVEGRAIRTKGWSKDGKSIYYESGNNLFSLDLATGNPTQLTHFEPQSTYRDFRVDPRENQISYVGVQNGQTDIWVASVRGENPFKVTEDQEADRSPIWHPDGRRIIYLSNRGGAFQVCVAYLDKSMPIQITAGSEDHIISDISADGRRFLDVGSRDNADIFAVDAETGRESELTSGSGLMLWPELSPDGRMIAFQSTNALDKVATNSTIFVKRPASGGPMTQIATDGFGPTWSPDGSRLAFLRFVEGRFELFTATSSGQSETRLTTGGVITSGYYLLPAGRFGRNICWSTGGDALIYVASNSGMTDVWSVASDGTSREQLTANSDSKQSIYEPLCGPDNKIAFAAKSNQGTQRTWSIWVKNSVETKRIYEGHDRLRPIGWLADDDELLAASMMPEQQLGYPTTVKLLRISIDGSYRPAGTLDASYFWSVQSSPDGQAVAFVSARGGADNIWMTGITGAEVRKLTANNEPKVFFPSLSWSSDGKTIYFGKQSSVGLIRMIDNFD